MPAPIGGAMDQVQVTHFETKSFTGVYNQVFQTVNFFNHGTALGYHSEIFCLILAHQGESFMSFGLAASF
jgi:hypothetical protein